jgi:hypothetical protein
LNARPIKVDSDAMYPLREDAPNSVSEKNPYSFSGMANGPAAFPMQAESIDATNNPDRSKENWMEKGKVAGDRKVVNGQVVIRRKKAERGASPAEEGAGKDKKLNASEFETKIKREISGFLYD